MCIAVHTICTVMPPKNDLWKKICKLKYRIQDVWVDSCPLSEVSQFSDGKLNFTDRLAGYSFLTHMSDFRNDRLIAYDKLYISIVHYG